MLEGKLMTKQEAKRILEAVLFAAGQEYGGEAEGAEDTEAAGDGGLWVANGREHQVSGCGAGQCGEKREPQGEARMRGGV